MGVQILSFEMLRKFKTETRLNKILDILKEGDVVVLEGRLTSDEETALVTHALENVSGKFTGIEIAYLDPKHQHLSFFESLKEKLIQFLAKERLGITVIGPSKIIKEIKMDPQKLEVLFK
jgi:hypothetical protein